MTQHYQNAMQWMQVELSPTASGFRDQDFSQNRSPPVRPTLKDIQNLGLGDEQASTNFQGKYEEAIIVQDMWIRWYEAFVPLFGSAIKRIITANASKQDLWEVNRILEALPPLPNIIRKSTPAIEEIYEGVWQLRVYVDWVYWAQKAENAYEAIADRLAEHFSPSMTCSERSKMWSEDDLGMRELNLRDLEDVDEEELIARFEEILPPRLDVLEEKVQMAKVSECTIYVRRGEGCIHSV